MTAEEKLFAKRYKQFLKILDKKNIKKIESVAEHKIKITYNSGAIFTCSGPLVEEAGVVEFERQQLGLFF